MFEKQNSETLLKMILFKEISQKLLNEQLFLKLSSMDILTWIIL